MFNKADLEQFYKNAMNYEKVDTGISGVLLTRVKATKDYPHGRLMVDINPLDPDKMSPTKWKGLYIHESVQFEGYRDIINEPILQDLMEDIPDVDVESMKVNEKVKTELPGVFYTRVKATKAYPLGRVMINISPLDPLTKKPANWKGLYLGRMVQYEGYKRALNDPELGGLIDTIGEINIEYASQKIRKLAKIAT